MIKLLDELPRRPRGRACIVLTHKYNEQRDWAAQLAKQTGMDYLDLLDLFAGDKDLSEEVSSFDVSKLFSLFQKKDKRPVLIVTGIEFLKAAWAAEANAIEQFASHVETWSKSPALLFVLQFDAFVAERKFTRFPQYIFVVDQKETIALP